ncbi:MAG TPA: LysR family transcriptional regulator [Agitococcus sp.]|mgnify:CR=1 FL=1|nr:LysR family transcriptional regulator [Agitococcus sp.]HNP02678.1 LysR family transcriptional regulator [Agitococcus sp.]
MDRVEAMRVFCTVVEAGSFASAADKLIQSTSAVSRWVAQQGLTDPTCGLGK